MAHAGGVGALIFYRRGCALACLCQRLRHGGGANLSSAGAGGDHDRHGAGEPSDQRHRPQLDDLQCRAQLGAGLGRRVDLVERHGRRLHRAGDLLFARDLLDLALERLRARAVPRQPWGAAVFVARQHRRRLEVQLAKRKRPHGAVDRHAGGAVHRAVYDALAGVCPGYSSGRRLRPGLVADGYGRRRARAAR